MRAPGTAACLVSIGVLLPLVHPGGVRAQSGPALASEKAPAGAPAAVRNSPTPPTPCILILKNGTSMRAEVVEDDARADSILIKYPAGGMARVPRAVLRTIQPLPLADPQAPQALAGRAVVPPLTADSLELTLTSNKPGLFIQRIKAEDSTFHFSNFSITTTTESEPLCSTPCAARVSGQERNSRFRVTGDGIPKADFTLPPQAAAATVNIVAGNTAAWVAGFVIIGAGATLAVIGTSEMVNSSLPDVQRFGLGIPVLGVGLAALGGGIALAVKYRTQVRVSISKPPTTSP